MASEDADALGRANVEALRHVYEEWARGNWRPRFDLYADDLEWGWSDEFPDLAGVYRDPQQRNARLQAWLSSWEDWRCVAEGFVAAGELVVVLTRYSGRGRESGVDVDVEGAHFWTMRDGRAIRLEIFSSRERALEAAGLRD